MAKVRSKSRRLKRKSIRKTRRSRMSTMSPRGGSEDISFDFNVILKGEPGQYEDPSKHADKIVKWYESMIADFEDEYPNPKITHVTKNKFHGSYSAPSFQPKYGTVKSDIEFFIDRDEDGNHPLKIGNKEFLVIGELVKIY
jgi:hypothetical protein